jgi:hypothetical protein
MILNEIDTNIFMVAAALRRSSTHVRPHQESKSQFCSSPVVDFQRGWGSCPCVRAVKISIQN